MRFGGALLALLLAAFKSGAQIPPECSSCHPAEAKLHSSTRMAHAMMPVEGSAFAQNLPGQPLQESADGYRFSYNLMTKRWTVSAFRGESRIQGVIEWVWGAGAQGQTPVVRSNGSFFESRVSYFPQLHQYGITVGQDRGASSNPLSALGHKLSPRDLQSCEGCHATAITRDLEPVIPGIQCARCHSGAQDHALGKGRPPSNPGKLTAKAQVLFCGNCHRSKPPVDDSQLENVRFQPYRLMKSRCFESGKLACITCHPAHQDARRNAPAFYNEKCHACHDSQPAHIDQRQAADCIGCHMPNVQLHPALRFTDHFIRVVKAGDLPGATLRQRGS